MKRKLGLSIVLIAVFNLLNGQNNIAENVIQKEVKLPIENTELFSISMKTDTISMKTDTVHFIRISEQANLIKPVLIFCSFSQPVPLILIDDKNGPMISGTGGFDYKEISCKYHIIMISKPYTPIIKNFSELNSAAAFVPDITKPNEFDGRYLERNYLEYHVAQVDAVIEFLKNQMWVQKDRIIILGHSQGAHVAAHVAMNNSDIYALGYFSGNVMGRFSQMINEVQNLTKRGEISKEEAQVKTNNLYEFWKYTCRELYWQGGDPPHTWMSFSRQYINEFTQIKAPVFIAYGTEDQGCQQNVMLPVYLELAGKTNYVMRPFVGYGHDFQEILPDGSQNYDNWRWNILMDEFIQWCERLSVK